MSGQRHLRNFIAGEYVDGRTDSSTEIVNPHWPRERSSAA